MSEKNVIRFPLISIVIPVYNVEAYVNDCIKSVLEQSYVNIQIILIDDGSTDNSGKMCDVWAEKDERISVVHQQNRGLSDSRNLGIELAEGEYIAFLDSDDMYHRNYLTTLYSIMQEYDVDIVQCGIERFVDGKTLQTQQIEKDISVEIFDAKKMNTMIYTSGVIDYTVVWNKLYKRHMFKDIRFPSKKIHEDTFTTFKLYYLANKIAVISTELYGYRQRRNSIMRQTVSERNIDMLDAFEDRLSYYANIEDTQLYFLCLERYMYSAMVLYGKAIQDKTNAQLAEVLYIRAKEVYSKMKSNKEMFSHIQMLKAHVFIRMPKTYCVIDRVRGIGKRVLNKISICKR